MSYKKVTTSIEFDKINDCPALIAIKAISGKWKTRILWLLRSGEMQFNELRRNLNGVSAKVLTDQLRELEREGIVFRRQSTEAGVQVSHYGYTKYGSTLVPVLDALGNWGLQHHTK